MTKRQNQKLRSGFTTGAAAAAAAKGALRLLLEGKAPSGVRIHFLTGAPADIALHTCEIRGTGKAVCTVIKDGGDDPDITHEAVIGTAVSLPENPPARRITISGGKGVGTVTKPGLEVAVGQPAINPGPHTMIRQEIMDVLERHQSDASVHVEVFVPEGERLAKNTLNARLGILGGISILGTTGIVRPMSHEAYVATIQSSLAVARASGVRQVVLTTGRRSEKFSQALLARLPEEAFIQIGDFFKVSLTEAAQRKFETVTLAVFFGKAVKMAMGIPHTHAAKSELTLSRLAQWVLAITGNRELGDHILNANTARHAFDYLFPAYPPVIYDVGRRMIRSARAFAGAQVNIQSIIFDFEGRVIFDSGIG